MADPRLFRLRVVYRKGGRLANLSHLEISRALERAVRRSGLPFAITNGFSPHMRIAFGAALPVGVGGDAEIFDIFLTGYVAPDKAFSALREASAEDLAPISCSYVESNAPAASVALPLGTYAAVFDRPLERLVVPDTIVVRRKKKEKEIAVWDFLVDEPVIRDDAEAGASAASEAGAASVVGSDAGAASEADMTSGDGAGSEVRFSLVAKDDGSLRADLLLEKCLEATYGAADSEGAAVSCSADIPRLISLTRISQSADVPSSMLGGGR